MAGQPPTKSAWAQTQSNQTEPNQFNQFYTNVIFNVAPAAVNIIKYVGISDSASRDNEIFSHFSFFFFFGSFSLSLSIKLVI